MKREYLASLCKHLMRSVSEVWECIYSVSLFSIQAQNTQFSSNYYKNVNTKASANIMQITFNS